MYKYLKGSRLEEKMKQSYEQCTGKPANASFLSLRDKYPAKSANKLTEGPPELRLRKRKP